MSGIVIGGLLGAAAAMYLSRSNRTFSFSGMGAAGQALDNLVEKARSRMMDPDKRSYYGDANSQSSAAGSSGMAGSMNSASTSGQGLDRVESIVKQDPMLKNQVNDILSESRDTSTIR